MVVESPLCQFLVAVPVSMSDYMLCLTLDALKSFFTGYGEVTNKSLMRH